MNFQSILALAAVWLCLAAALAYMIRHRGGCGGCSGCAGNCGGCGKSCGARRSRKRKKTGPTDSERTENK